LLFLLKNGPVHSLGDHIEHQLAVLSREFDCELWAPGSIDADTVLPSGGRVRIFKAPDKPSVVQTLRFAMRVYLRVRQLRKAECRELAVIAHDPLKNGLLGVAVSKLAGVPLIIEVNGVYSAVENYNVTVATASIRLRIALYRRVAAFTLHHAAAVRLLFASQLRDFVHLRPGTPRKVFFDIVSLDRFQNKGNEPTVLFVGYPFVTKGVDVLIKAFESICADHPSWKLQLIGHDLIDKVKECTRNPRIEVLRAMSNEQLAEFMNRAGIFVLPSRSEAMGRVLLEAAAAGKPRIGSQVGGIPTVIEDEVDGLLFQKENVAELAELLRRLMGSAELCARLGAAARRRIEKEFSDDAYLANMIELTNLVFTEVDVTSDSAAS